MADLENLERIRKTNDKIIKSLTDDTKKGKLHWYTDDKTIYTRLVKILGEDESTTRIDLIFKISDETIEDEYNDYAHYFGYEQSSLFETTIVTLEIYMSKNKKKEVFCKKISTDQLALSDLLGVILPIVEKKPIVK